MRVNQISLALLLVSSILASARAQGPGEGIAVLPNHIVWKAPSVSPGPDTAVTYGDPSKPGVYVMRVRFPAGFKLMPHFHPDEWRTGVVLSGNYYFALGEQWDQSKLRAYPAGTFFSEPKGTPDFVWAKGWRSDRPIHRHGADGPYAHPAKGMMAVRHKGSGTTGVGTLEIPAG